MTKPDDGDSLHFKASSFLRHSSFVIRASSFPSHLHNLSFLVLEMIVDRFNEAVGQLLNFRFEIVESIFTQSAGSFEFFRLVMGGAPVVAHTNARFLGHFS